MMNTLLLLACAALTSAEALMTPALTSSDHVQLVSAKSVLSSPTLPTMSDRKPSKKVMTASLDTESKTSPQSLQPVERWIF